MINGLTEIDGEEPDPFLDWEPAELMAFIYREGGEAELRAALESLSRATREGLEKDAAELAQLGLTKAAVIVRKAAKTAPRELDLCPYPDTPENVTNRKAWFFSKRQDYGLCAYCGAEKIEGTICDNGQTCAERWRDLMARAPKPPVVHNGRKR